MRFFGGGAAAAVARAATAAILIGVLWWYLRPGRLWSVLLQAQPWWVGAGGILGGLGLVVQWLKWQRLLSVVRPGAAWSEGLQSLLLGYGLGLVSPGRIGELGRGLFLGGDRAALVGLAGVDRLSSFLVAVSMAWVALLVLSPVWSGAVGLLLAALGWLGWRCHGRMETLLQGWSFATRAWAAVVRVPGRVWWSAIGWSAVSNLVLFAQFGVLLRSWGSLSWAVLGAVPLVFCLKALLPVSLLDLGVREAVAVVILTRMQLDPAVAFNASMLIFTVNVFLPGVVGLFLLWQQAHHPRPR